MDTIENTTAGMPLDLQAVLGTHAEAIGRRIREARGDLSQKEFAAILGIHSNTLGKVERGDVLPDTKLVLQIAFARKVSPSWLLLGETPETCIHPDVASDSEFVAINAYGIKASAGNGNQIVQEDVIGRFAFSRSWLRRKGLNPGDLAIVAAKGDSMEPTIRSEDILLVDRQVTRITADGIYLVERDNELYCKRLQRLFNGGVAIMSDNDKYKPQELDEKEAEQIRVVGRVVWIGGER